jgi:peroxiredoxin
MIAKKIKRISIFCISAIFIFALFFTGTKSAFADTADCVLVHGRADANISIVFLSDYPDNVVVASSTLEIAYNYLRKDEDKIAFYLDKKKQMAIVPSMDSEVTVQAMVEAKNGSSCVGKTYYVEVSNFPPAFFLGKADLDNGIILISNFANTTENRDYVRFQRTLIHEMGHLIGKLSDERGTTIPLLRDQGYHPRQINCVSKSIVDNYWSPYLGIDTNNPECAWFTKENNVSSGGAIEVRYKDKQPSIMNSRLPSLNFNKISCAWFDLGLSIPGGLTLSKINEVNSSQSNFDTILGPHLNKCGAYKATKFSMDIPIVTNCIQEDFLADVSKDIDASADIIISAEQDIQLSPILNAGWWRQLWGNDKNFFKINDTDVSVDDGAGGRKIPAGHLKTIPQANIRDIKFKTGDQYCRINPITLSFEVNQMSLNSPFACFGKCP